MENKKLTLDEKLRQIKLIVSDIDGVLTDGKIYFSGDSEEIKCFNAKDAPRIATALRSGLKVVWLTARRCAAVVRRASELKVDLVFKQDLKEKSLKFLDEMLNRYNAKPEEILYCGDDWSDLFLMKQVGVSVTPADGSAENKEIADIITKANGGQGVAAEVIEMLMRAKGTWKKYSEQYISDLIY